MKKREFSGVTLGRASQARTEREPSFIFGKEGKARVGEKFANTGKSFRSLTKQREEGKELVYGDLLWLRTRIDFP